MFNNSISFFFNPALHQIYNICNAGIRFIIVLFFIFTGSITISSTAYAEEVDELKAMIEKMERQHQQEMELMKNQIDALSNELQMQKENETQKQTELKTQAAEVAKKEVAKATENLPEINTRGKLEIKSRDGDHSFRIGGRLQHDVTLVNTDGDYGDDDGSSESQFRRARLYLSGTTFKYWDFKFQYDFEDTQDDDQAIEDAYIKYTGWPVKITVGQRKAPYSMHEFTSSKYTTFIERSMASELFNAQQIGVGNREMGITFTHEWNTLPFGNYLIAEGGYYLMRTTVGGNGCAAGAECDIDDGRGFTGRLAWADYDDKARTLLHAGVSGGQKTYSNNVVNRIRVRPGVSEGSRIVDTDTALAADDYWTYNFNLAGMYKRFWASGEYFHGEFDLTTPGVTGDDDMESWYVQGGVFLTDDSRRYKAGGWDSVKPKAPVGKGGIGAWEVALRYDSVELGDALHAGADDEKGETFSVALNWYPINNIRFQANYVNTMCDGSTTNPECDWGNGDPSFFIFRSQIWF